MQKGKKYRSKYVFPMNDKEMQAVINAAHTIGEKAYLCVCAIAETLLPCIELEGLTIGAIQGNKIYRKNVRGMLAEWHLSDEFIEEVNRQRAGASRKDRIFIEETERERAEGIEEIIKGIFKAAGIDNKRSYERLRRTCAIRQYEKIINNVEIYDIYREKITQWLNETARGDEFYIYPYIEELDSSFYIGSKE